jgi:tetratricopeptide (TPR) repeat protein
MQQGQPPAALSIVSRLLKAELMSRSTSSVEIRTVWDELSHGDPIQALNSLQAIVAQNPDSAESLVALARAEIATGRDHHAIGHLQRAKQIAPHDPAIDLDLSVAYYNLDRREESLSILERIVYEAGDWEGKQFALLYLDAFQGEHREVISKTENMPSLIQSNIVASLVAIAYLEVGDYQKCRQVSAVLTERFPNSYWSYFIIGRCHIGSNSLADAMSYLETALSFEPRDINVYRVAFRTAFRLRRFYRALQILLDGVKHASQ